MWKVGRIDSLKIFALSVTQPDSSFLLMLRQQEMLKGNRGPTAEFLRVIGRKKEKHVKDPKDVGETNHEPFQFFVKKTYEKES